MSASREKKTRQELSGQELSEKQIKARQEAAKAKRNKVVYTVLGAVCTVAVVALLIWNSGVFQNRAAAVTIAGQTYTAGDVQYYYTQIFDQYYVYSQWGMVSGFDYTVDPDEQMYDEANGVTWYDQMMNEALSTMANTKVLAAQAKEEGVELSEEGAASVEEAMQDLLAQSAENGYYTVNSYLKSMFGRTMNKTKYEALLKEGTLASEFQQAYLDSREYTDEQLEEIYENHKTALDRYDYNMAFFSATTGEETLTEEELAEYMLETLPKVEEKANAFHEKLKTMSFGDALKLYEEDKTVSSLESRGMNPNSITTDYATWVVDASRKAGDTTMLLDSQQSGYFVVEYLGRAREDEITGDVRHIFVAAETSNGSSVPSDEQYEAALAKAEAILQKWKDGAATEESFIELVKAESADEASVENGGLYEQVSSASSYVKTFRDWATDPERKPGDTGIVKNGSSKVRGYHVMYFVGHNEPLWKIEATEGQAEDDTTSWITGLVAEAKVERLDGLKYVK